MATTHTTPVKTQGQALIALSTLASNSVAISSAVDVSSVFAATVFLHFGRASDTALSTGLTFRVEASSESSGNTDWIPVAQFTSKIAAVVSNPVNGTAAAGTNVIATTTTTGFAVDDIVFILNTSTTSNSEWARVKSISAGTSITVEDNLTRTQINSVIFPAGEMYAAQIDLMAIGRLRVVANGDSTGQATAIQARMVTCDNMATT